MKNLKKWWKNIDDWKRALITFVVLSILISIISLSNYVFDFKIPYVALAFLLIIGGLSGLFLWLDVKNPKYYWGGGFIATMIYLFFFAIIDSVAKGGADLGTINSLLIFPFGFISSSLFTIPAEYFLILFLFNLITLTLVGILIGFMLDKIKQTINNNLKNLCRRLGRMGKIIGLIVTLNIFFSIKFIVIAYMNENISNLIFNFIIISIVLIILGLLCWGYAKNPKPYWKGGVITITIYFTVLTFAFFDFIGPKGGEYTFLIIPLLFPFGFLIYYLLPLGLTNTEYTWLLDLGVYVLNILGIVLVGILIGLIDYKIKKKR